MDIHSAIFSADTASDIPGPSRTLGKLLSYLGEKLEQRLDELADRLGYGPSAVLRRVESHLTGYSFNWAHGQKSILESDLGGELRRDLQKLVNRTT